MSGRTEYVASTYLYELWSGKWSERYDFAEVGIIIKCVWEGEYADNINVVVENGGIYIMISLVTQ